MLVGPGEKDMHAVSHSQAVSQRRNKGMTVRAICSLPRFHVVLAQKQPDNWLCGTEAAERVKTLR